ncbi:MAG: hypothetical protein ACLTPN_03805 [Clostridia bacterium]
MSTNEIRQEFMKKYKVEGIKLWEYPPSIDRFFTHEFENMQDAINGIIFYTNHDIHQKEALLNTHKIETEIKIKNLKDETLNNCVHFFRFTEVLNNSDFNEDYSNIKNGVKVYKKINIDEIQKLVQNRIDELIEKEKIQVWRAGLYFTRQEEAYYKRSYAYQTNLQEHNSAWWTEDLFSTIKYLKNLEENDENTYYDTWVHCKIEREKNKKGYMQKNNENAKLLEKAYSEYKRYY